MQDFRELQVWQISHELALAVYDITQGFPREERYGLTSQMRRAAVSIPANIAEGRCRKGDTDFARFLQIAMGSASELEYYFILTNDLNLISTEETERLTGMNANVKKMLTSFVQRLRADG
jgi:four helix bundle protein